jgi:hypothetical protein
MPCRYSLNKKQRKKGKKAKPVRYISTCVQTEKLFKDKEKIASSLTMTKWQAVPNQPKALDMLLLSNSKS